MKLRAVHSPRLAALLALAVAPWLVGCGLNSSHNEVADWWYTETPDGNEGPVGNGTRETPYKGSSQTSVTNANNKR